MRLKIESCSLSLEQVRHVFCFREMVCTGDKFGFTCAILVYTFFFLMWKQREALLYRSTKL